ncbi:MAG TPA: SDR family oxidoreductase [Myxococcota bacterium]|nr:SDR family oxidoreductase [Myxococcota bacterium]
MSAETNDLPLSGKRMLVIGGSRGIGFATARLLARHGAHVVISARRKPVLQEALVTLEREAPGASLDAIACNGANPKQLRRAVDFVAEGGGLHALVCIPGAGTFSPLLAFDDDAFRGDIEANVMPAFFAVKYGGRAIAQSGGGSIVLMSSNSAAFSNRYLGGYGAAKAAVDYLARVAADELGHLGVRVNSVRPGITKTDGTELIASTPKIRKRFLAQQPLRHLGAPEEIADAIRFLCGPESRWITGQNLTIDGGHSLRAFPELAELARGAIGAERFARANDGTIDD